MAAGTVTMTLAGWRRNCTACRKPQKPSRRTRRGPPARPRRQRESPRHAVSRPALAGPPCAAAPARPRTWPTCRCGVWDSCGPCVWGPGSQVTAHGPQGGRGQRQGESKAGELPTSPRSRGVETPVQIHPTTHTRTHTHTHARSLDTKLGFARLVRPPGASVMVLSMLSNCNACSRPA